MRTPAQPSPADTFLTLCLVLNEVHMRTVKQLHKRLVRAPDIVMMVACQVARVDVNNFWSKCANVPTSSDTVLSTQHGRGRFAAAGVGVLVLVVAATSWTLPWQPAPPPAAPSAVPVQLESAARAATQAEQQLRIYVHPLRVTI